MKLLTPGPVEVPEEVLAEASARVVSHRSEEFHKLYSGVQQLLRKLYGLNNGGFVALLAGSGTTAVDAMAWSGVGRGERVLVVSHGVFGDRLAETLERRGARVEVLRPPKPGEPVEEDTVIEKLEDGGYDVLALVHNETSVGLAYRSLPKLCKAAGRAGVRVIVDTVSGLGGEPFSMEWGVAAAASASHKAIAAPPGVSFVAVSRTARLYRDVPLALDLERYRLFDEKLETPFTPPVTLVRALRRALERIMEMGVDRYIAMHRERARILYEELPRLGLEPVVTREEYRSNTVAAFYTPVSAVELRKRLAKMGYIIATGMGELRDRVVRVGVMGDLTLEDMLGFVEAVEKVLGKV